MSPLFVKSDKPAQLKLFIFMRFYNALDRFMLLLRNARTDFYLSNEKGVR